MDARHSRFLGGVLAIAFAGTSAAADAANDYSRQVIPTAVQTSPSDSHYVMSDGTSDNSGSGCSSCLSCDVGPACGSGCCDSAGGCDSLGCDTGLLGYGLVKRSDSCFNDFVSPMTNPVFFEDPRNLSEIRFIFLSHELPGSLGGNSVQVYAMQVRAAITDRLSIIATKDGFVSSQSPILDSGYADVAAGLKYNLYRDVCNGRLFSVGMTYEIPMGSNRSLQGNGNGEFHFFATGGTRIGDKGHWISASGIREPLDTNQENRVWYWSNHFDRQVGDRPVYAFTEFNWFHYTGSGNAFGPIEGGDLFNLGAAGVTGNDLVTQAVGLKVKPRKNIEAGIAYEFPLTQRKGIMENRFTADLIFRF